MYNSNNFIFESKNEDELKREIVNTIRNISGIKKDVIIDAGRNKRNSDSVLRYERSLNNRLINNSSINNRTNNIINNINIIHYNQDSDQEINNYNINNLISLIDTGIILPPILSRRIYSIFNQPENLEDVPTPLNRDDINRLEKCTFSSITNEKIGRDIDSECAICQSSFEPTNNVIILPCAGHHYFHDTCISPWLQISKKCPVCRENIEDTLRNNN